MRRLHAQKTGNGRFRARISWLIALLLVGCNSDQPFAPSPRGEQNWSLLATGERLVDVWGNSSTDVFVLGSAGTLLHYNGANWSNFTAPASSSGSIWGTSSRDLYIADQRSIYHYDGRTWERVYSGATAFSDIWGTLSRDIFAVSNNNLHGAILHYDGVTWTQMLGSPR